MSVRAVFEACAAVEQVQQRVEVLQGQQKELREKVELFASGAQALPKEGHGRHWISTGSLFVRLDREQASRRIEHEVQRTRDELRAVEEELPRQEERERVLAAELRALLGQGQWSEGKWTSSEVVAQLSALVDALSRAGPVPAPVSRGLVEDALL